VPLMRHLLLAAPGQKWPASAVDSEFGFGDDILAAPIVAAGSIKRSVYLPRATGSTASARGPAAAAGGHVHAQPVQGGGRRKPRD
jgi:hypothetical protein